MQKFYLFFLILLCSQFVEIHVSCADDKTIVFATEEWKDATHRDGSGLYWDILRTVYELGGYKIKPLIRSYKGSVTLVKEKSVDAMIGAYIDEIEEGIYPENHFAVDIVTALYKKKLNFQWNGLNSIIGKKICWIEGYFYHEYLPASVVKSLSIRRVDTRETAFRLLNLSLTDFILDAEGDLNDFLNDNPEYQANHFVKKKILEQKLYIVFSDTKKGKQLVHFFDQEFSKRLKAGTIKKLYNKYSNSNFTFPSDF